MTEKMLKFTKDNHPDRPDYAVLNILNHTWKRDANFHFRYKLKEHDNEEINVKMEITVRHGSR